MPRPNTKQRERTKLALKHALMIAFFKFLEFPEIGPWMQLKVLMYQYQAAYFGNKIPLEKELREEQVHS